MIDDAAILEGEELVQGVLSSTAIVGRFSEGDVGIAVYGGIRVEQKEKLLLVPLCRQ